MEHNVQIFYEKITKTFSVAIVLIFQREEF